MGATATSTQIKFQYGSPLAYHLLEGVMSQSGGPGGAKSVSDITAINATVNLDRDGRPTYNAIKTSGSWDPVDPSHVAVLAAIQSDAPAAGLCEIGTTLGTTPGLQFSGYIDEWGLAIPNEGPCILTTGITITTAITKAANSSVTPNAVYDPETGQGAKLKLLIGSVYTQIAGVENIAYTGMMRNAVPATPLDVMAPATLPGTRTHGTMSFDLLYDTSDAQHVLLEAAYAAIDQADGFQVLLTSTKTITCIATVNGWEVQVGAKNAPNRVRVSTRLTSNVVVA